MLKTDLQGVVDLANEEMISKARQLLDLTVVLQQIPNVSRKKVTMFSRSTSFESGVSLRTVASRLSYKHKTI
jgi:hypothetical protein